MYNPFFASKAMYDKIEIRDWYTIPYSYDWSLGYFYSVCPHRQFHTQSSSRTALANFYPSTYLSSREGACTIFMMVFGMGRPGREPTTYRMRGGYANHLAISTQFDVGNKKRSLRSYMNYVASSVNYHFASVD